MRPCALGKGRRHAGLLLLNDAVRRRREPLFLHDVPGRREESFVLDAVSDLDTADARWRRAWRGCRLQLHGEKRP